MTLEVLGAWFAKFSWTVLLPYFVWNHKQNKVKLDNTLSKKEADKLIDLKLEPLELKVDHKTESLHEKFDLLLSIVKTDTEQSIIERKENSTILHSISTDVAVIRNEVDNLKERIE